MEEKLDSLEKKVLSVLHVSSETKMPEAVPEKKERTVPEKTEIKKTETTKSESTEEETNNPMNEITIDELDKSVKGVIGENNIFKHFCFKIFSLEELRNCTRTGKKTIKCHDVIKPALNTEKLDILQTSVIKHTSFDRATFVKKNLRIYKRSSSEATKWQRSEHFFNICKVYFTLK